MKLVVDVNIFVSGAFWKGTPGVVVDRVLNAADTLLVSDDIMCEIEDVLNKSKFEKHKKTAEDTIRRVKEAKIKIIIPPDLSVADSGCRDPDDLMYLECAVAGGADYLISGDGDLRVLKKYRGVTIVNPREYLDIIGV